MRAFHVFLGACLAMAFDAFGGGWEAAEDLDREIVAPGLSYVQRTALRRSDGKEVRAHLALFASQAFRLRVIDLGAGATPRYATIEDAFRDAGVPAGVNGGFFHPDWRPLGLVISEGRRIHRFETSRLLSGVVYSDERGIHLVRRRQFRDRAGIDALLQTGPYLVEEGRVVRGLSTSSPRRRTFIATDWRGHWALGATLTPLTLAELGQCLASPGALTDWTTDRAINLDGGSSTGFFFDPGAGQEPVLLRPLGRVRNLLGILPR